MRSVSQRISLVWLILIIDKTPVLGVFFGLGFLGSHAVIFALLRTSSKNYRSRALAKAKVTNS